MDGQRMPSDAVATKTASTSSGERGRSTSKSRPGQQTLALPLSGRLDAQRLKRAHKRLAVQLNQARDVLLQAQKEVSPVL